MVYLNTVKSFIKKCLLFFGGIVLTGFVAGALVFLLYNEKLPQGESGDAANAKTMAMMKALNKDQWDQIKTLKWTFNGRHHYNWDKQNNIVSVKWNGGEVLLQPDQQTGSVISPSALSQSQQEKYIQKAYRMFNNDGFWMAGPYKILDPGTERSLVTLADGREGLKVKYTQGGDTPGDSYVWILDENNLPVAVKMWVSVIPLGGVESTWENYYSLGNGVSIAQDHKLLNLINAKISNLEATFTSENSSRQNNEEITLEGVN